MPNIVLFKSQIIDVFSPAYKTYIDLYNNNIIDNPIIFTDYCNIPINNDICVFNAYFLRNHFFNFYILMDYEDIEYVNNIRNRKCLVIYNELFHNISNLNSNYITIELESDHIKNIKDIVNEQI